MIICSRCGEKFDSGLDYTSLGEINEELNNIKSTISGLREDLEADRKINEGEFRKLGGNIQNTIGMINAVKEDKNMLKRS